MMKVPVHKIPADFADRFPDGDYTVGRGANPRTGSGKIGDQVPRLAVKPKKTSTQVAKKRVTRPAAE